MRARRSSTVSGGRCRRRRRWCRELRSGSIFCGRAAGADRVTNRANSRKKNSSFSGFFSETSWLIDSGPGWCDREAELGCLLSEELYLLLAVSLLVVFRAFVDVLLTVLQHAIDQSGEPVGHRGNGFGGAELGAQSAVLGSKVAAAANQRGRCH